MFKTGPGLMHQQENVVSRGTSVKGMSMFRVTKRVSEGRLGGLRWGGGFRAMLLQLLTPVKHEKQICWLVLFS